MSKIFENKKVQLAISFFKWLARICYWVINGITLFLITVFMIFYVMIDSFSYPSQDEDACYFPSEAFVAALLAKQDSRICRLLSKSTLRGYVFKVAIYTKNKAYIEKYFDKADFYLNGKQIIALFELGCKNIAEEFLRIFGFMSKYDDEFLKYLHSHNYNYNF